MGVPLGLGRASINENVPADIRRVYARDDVDDGWCVSINTNMSPNDPAAHSLVIDDRVAVGLLAGEDGTAKIQTLFGNAVRDVELTADEVFWLQSRSVRTGTNLLGDGTKKLFALFAPSAGQARDRAVNRTSTVQFVTATGEYDPTDFALDFAVQNLTLDEIQVRRTNRQADPDVVHYLQNVNGTWSTVDTTWLTVDSDLRTLDELRYGTLSPYAVREFQIRGRNSDDQATAWSPSIVATAAPPRCTLVSPNRSGGITTGPWTWEWTVENIQQDELMVQRASDGSFTTDVQWLNAVNGSSWTNAERWLDVAEDLRSMSFGSGWITSQVGTRYFRMRVRDSNDTASFWSHTYQLSPINP